MNRLVLSNKNEDKKIITFDIAPEIKLKLKELLLSSKNYHAKSKSEWVNEAIAILKENPDYREMVTNADGTNRTFVFDKIYMTFQQRCFFAEMRSEVVRANPDIKGPQGAIIRAAIMGRLMRKI